MSCSIPRPQIARHSLVALALLGFALLLVGPARRAAAITPGDRHIPLNIQFPKNALVAAGGRVIDVTQAPYLALPDGHTDCTAALVAAMNFVRDKIKQFGCFSPDASYVLYFPNGTYLVSDTIIHDGEMLPSDLSMMHIVGQDRAKTIIRLKDNCPAFGAGTYKPVMTVMKGFSEIQRSNEFSNIAFGNMVRNITINTGSGNPGAVGLVFHGANTCMVEDVTINSGDGAGRVGLDMPIGSVQGLIRDLTVDGFDTGIDVRDLPEVDATLEYVTLKHQRKVALHVNGGGLSIRGLLSDNALNSIPAVVADWAANLVIIDSRLMGRSGADAAIRLNSDAVRLFARKVSCAGYTATVAGNGMKSVVGDISEYVKGEVSTLFQNQTLTSLNLPIEDAPAPISEPNMNQWADVDMFPGADMTAKVQNALNSGKTTIYFPGAKYRFGDVTVPASVRMITGLYGNVDGQIHVNQASVIPLRIEFINGYGTVSLESTRTVALALCSCRLANRQKAPVKVFIDACANIGVNDEFCTPGENVWCRSINCEEKGAADIKVYGGTFWTLGFKTESPTTALEVKNGGFCEVLGGYRNECEADRNPPQPMISNVDSNVSFIGFTNMNTGLKLAVAETRNGATKVLQGADLPNRHGVYRDTYAVPLYCGYTKTIPPIKPPATRP